MACNIRAMKVTPMTGLPFYQHSRWLITKASTLPQDKNLHWWRKGGIPYRLSTTGRKFSDHPPHSKDFHGMWKRACDTAAKCIAEAKEYNKQRWVKSHIEPECKEGDKVLVCTLNFNNLKGPKKMRDSFLGPFTIIKLIGKNEVEPKLTE
ncbi:hypothetical protein O181_117748 [Austropuccinia psidii MF-1]|uniref:Uncharacterized protein n=1 Tax=Austropuccinia psidii MF-1 TaxID=1389203 RepID=A0A9Q3KAW5_9BASI|nr:hypothetical protein [Austropuccinia psidii MF-1]